MSERKESLDFAQLKDLIAYIVIAANKYYLENAPKLNDSRSPIFGLSSARHEAYKQENPKQLGLQGSSSIAQFIAWSGQSFYTVHDNTVLKKRNGEPESGLVGKEEATFNL